MKSALNAEFAAGTCSACSVYTAAQGIANVCLQRMKWIWANIFMLMTAGAWSAANSARLVKACDMLTQQLIHRLLSKSTGRFLLMFSTQSVI